MTEIFIEDLPEHAEHTSKTEAAAPIFSSTWANDDKPQK